MSHVRRRLHTPPNSNFCGEPARIPWREFLLSFRTLSLSKGEESASTHLASVPHMLYRHGLDFEHQVRRHSCQLARKLPRLLLAPEDGLLLHLATQPLLTLPNHLLYHQSPPRILHPDHHFHPGVIARRA